MTPEPEDRVLTPQEVADFFRVHPKTVRRWAKKYGLGFHTLGGRLRFRESEVRRMLENIDPTEGGKALRRLE